VYNALISGNGSKKLADGTVIKIPRNKFSPMQLGDRTFYNNSSFMLYDPDREISLVGQEAYEELLLKEAKGIL
jgi:hypothetical protein